MAQTGAGDASATAPFAVVLIGMRGAGKSTLGAAAAELLGWRFTDLDQTITSSCGGKQPPQIVEERGWDAFRQLELQALAAALSPGDANPHVVSCGGGVVETQQGVETLQSHWPVVMIDAPREDVLRRLEKEAQEAHRADLGEDLRDVLARRLPRYRRCADVRFPVARGDADPRGAARSLARLLRRLAGQGGAVHLGPDTFALALTLPDCTQADPQLLRKLSLGADVLELRVDLLASLDPEFVTQQVAVLRRHTAGAPLLFTLRSADHGGRFAGPEQEYTEILKLGLALGVELLDLECTWSQACIHEIVAHRGTTLLVGSHYDIVQVMPDREDIHSSFKRCMLEGAAAVARVVVRGGSSREQNLLVQHMGNAAVPAGTAFVGLCAGKEGRLSCLLNQVLCPATHPELAPAEPGLLSIQELRQCRRTLSLLSRGRQFPVLGAWRAELPWLLATVLRGAFAGSGVGHASSEESVEAMEELQRLLSLDSVGGALATGSLRQALAPMMQQLSEEAQSVGAVDCAVRLEDGTLRGENAQTLAIRTRLEAVGLHNDAQSRVALLLGGGIAGRAALVALKAMGFGRILRANANSPLQEVQDLPTYTVILDKSKGGDSLGVDVSHNNGPSLRVEKVVGGLVGAWNAAHPELEVRAGDWLVAVNGVMGEAARLLGECAKDQLLQVSFVREAVACLADDPVEDLTVLAPLTSLDVIVLADLPGDGCRGVRGSQWVTSVLSRLRPLVLDTAWPPRPVHMPGSGPELLEAARAANCSLVEGAEVLLEQVCTCLAKWTGRDSLRQRAAKVLLEEVSKVQSGPMLLVDAANS